MEKVQLIKYLTSLRGVSGYEYRFSSALSDVFSKYCDEVKTDALGNVIGIKKSKTNTGQSVMIEAHTDEIGLMVTQIDDRGFVRFAPVGGIDAGILPAKQVVIHGIEDVRGVIGAKPPHITTAAEQNKVSEFKDLYIDTGYDAQKLRQIVSVGDTVTFDAKFYELGKKYISTKTQDDRTGVAVLVMTMERLKNVSLPFDVYYCACVQEEVGRRGALTAAYGINPTFAIAVDVCHASTPDASEGTFKAGSGTVVSLGPNIHPVLVKNVLACLDENNIEYSIDVDGGDTGTDAWAIQTARCGIPTVLFSLPLRYMHTMVETVNIADVNAASAAISAFLSQIDDAEVAVCFH